jgi:hypothetical protein
MDQRAGEIMAILTAYHDRTITADQAAKSFLALAGKYPGPINISLPKDIRDALMLEQRKSSAK